jgi:glycine C-acetyltransferase
MDMHTMNRDIHHAALRGSLKDYANSASPRVLERTADFFAWQSLRRRNGVWPYARSTESAPQTFCNVRNDDGVVIEGINFASQDYLGLSSHPHLKEVAIHAIQKYGVHSAGSGALLGNTANSLLLERKLSDFLRGRSIVLYPTGWSAGFASVQGFVRQNDHVVMDILAHSCLQEGARAAAATVHHFGHLSNHGLSRRLKKIRDRDLDGGILVVTESLFSMHSDVPDFATMRALCDEYNATLLVDCAHDLGAMGDEGLGNLATAGMLDSADILIGSFSKTFASNGGFIAVKDRMAAEYLKYYSATHTFSNALSPVQAATVGAAIDIVRSEEGQTLREKLMSTILYLRQQMVEAGLEALGTPSAIVPVRVGDEALGRLVSGLLPQYGVIANLVEYPAVPQGDSRFRFQVMANHTHDNVNKAVKALSDAIRDSRGAYLAHTQVDRSTIL